MIDTDLQEHEMLLFNKSRIHNKIGQSIPTFSTTKRN